MSYKLSFSLLLMSARPKKSRSPKGVSRTRRLWHEWLEDRHVLSAGLAPVAQDDAYSIDVNSSLTLSASPVSRLAMESTPGDFVGQGQSYEYTSATATFRADKYFDNGVTVAVDPPGPGEFWYLDFSAPFSVPLTPGVYENASRYPFQNDEQPGLQVAGNGRGYNQLAGEFIIYDVAYGPGTTIDRFAASFVQQGLDFDGSLDPPLTGIIQYNTTIGTNAGVLVNDSDADGDLLIATLVSGPANGALTLNADGTFSYTPDADFQGTDSFTYKANDGRLDSNTATVTITVGNKPPVAEADIATTGEDKPVTIDVLANDSDADGDPLTVVSAAEPANGSVVINPDGTITYTPNQDFSGSDSFEYTISDGNGGINSAVVSLTVLSKEQQIAILQQRIDDFSHDGVINHGQANSLQSKLKNVLKQLAKRHDKPAANEMNAFIHHVNGLVKGGKLTQSQGDLLIELAEDILVGIR